MPQDWFKVGVGYYRDPALLRAGEAAEVFFIRCLSYCAETPESKGRFPKVALPIICPVDPQPRVDALVHEKVLIERKDDYQVRSWDKWQEQLDTLHERRRKDRERKAEERERKKSVQGKSEDTSKDNPQERPPKTARTPLDSLEVEVENSLQSSSASEWTVDRDDLPDDPTSRLWTEHLNGYSQPLPGRQRDNWKVEIQKLVVDHIDEPRIRDALARCRQRGHGYGLLSSVVTEVTATNETVRGAGFWDRRG